MPSPTVRVVIPCFNYGRFVREAAESALAQEGAAVEVVIIDDGSDDGQTPGQCDECRGLGTTVIHQANAGLPATRNRGAAGASTDYLVFLDADDTIEPSFVRRLHEAIEADGGADVSHSYCDERFWGVHEGLWKVPEWDPLLALLTNLHPVTALVKRERFEEAGGFDESMRDGYEDWDLWLRFVERGWRGVRVAEALFNWRRHSAVTMITEANSRHERLYAALVRNHAALFAARASEALVRANAMLYRGGANWVDDKHEPIVIRDTLKHLEQVRGETEALRAEAEAARAAAASAGAAAAAAQREAEAWRAESERIRAEYERKPVVRLSRAVHGFMEWLPRPLGGSMRWAARLMRRAVPEKKEAGEGGADSAAPAAAAPPRSSPHPAANGSARAGSADPGPYPGTSASRAPTNAGP